jgi:hypothetical protein
MMVTKKLNRRQFLGLTGSAAAFTVLPRHVLGGINYVAPSDKITLGLIGCGTQQLRELPSLLDHPHVQIVSVCDPVKNPSGYIDWSPTGIRDRIREIIEEPAWGNNIKGMPGGRDVGKDVVDKFYKLRKASSGSKGVSSYADFRDMLENEKDMMAVKILTPDHQHATQAIASMKKGKHVVMHKPISNIVDEARKTIEIARQTGLMTHLLAYSKRNSYDLVKKWIDEGAIGTLREVHNWSFRPVWPQWSEYPTDTPPVPDGFDWDLWLGPVPDRPFHPNITHAVFRGWYEFGSGAVADMGLYSLYPLFETFGIDSPAVSIEALGGVNAAVNASVFQRVNNTVSFPNSCIFRWKFPQKGSSPPLEIFWYDGGMKPQNPPEMEADNLELESEGMMFVGDKGKIIGGFYCQNPRIIPERNMISLTGSADPPRTSVEGRDAWISALQKGEQSPGSFQNFQACNETILLASVALRAGRKIIYDPANMKVTNIAEADRFLYRGDYRKGWEL